MKYIIFFILFLGITSCSLGDFIGDKKSPINNNTGGVQIPETTISGSGKILDDEISKNPTGSGSREDIELQNIQKDIDAIFSDIEKGGK